MTILRSLDKAQWQVWYRALAWYAARQQAQFSCMNWGYDDGRTLVDERLDERYPLQLYHVLAEGIPLEDQRLLDASAGRGGGLRYLSRTRRPREALGVDFVPAHVRLAQRAVTAHDGPVHFVPGDAEHLPRPAGSVDVLVSVEASHCYASIERFLREAARVLRPGGWLLWTDFTTPAQLAHHDALVERDFEPTARRDITPEVLRAMAADGDRRRRLITQSAPRLLWPLLTHFAAADESCETVQRFHTGSHVYFLRRLRRREEA